MNKRQMRCAEVKEAGSSGGGIPRCQGNRSLMTSDNGAGKWVGVSQDNKWILASG